MVGPSTAVSAMMESLVLTTDEAAGYMYLSSLQFKLLSRRRGRE